MPAQPERPVGRPRNPAIDEAVLDAAAAALEETGYQRLSLEAVARRAGTSKPALYRRWASRQRLVLALYDRELGTVSPPDTGCTICDLVDAIGLFAQVFATLPPATFTGLLADCSADPALEQEFMATLYDPPRTAVAATLTAARERGDLRPDVDLDLTLDLLASLVHHRAAFGRGPGNVTEVERAVETLLQGVAADYPRLLAHSRESAGDPAVHAHHAG